MHAFRFQIGIVAVLATIFSSSLVDAAEPVPHPIVAGFERFGSTEAMPAARFGHLLLGELNCTACHASSNPAIIAKQAPILDNVATRVRVGHLRKYLADPQQVKPGTTMPNLFAGDPDKAEKVEALVQFLASRGTPKQERPDIKSAVLGRELYRKVGCVACHGPRDLLGDAEKKLPPEAVPLGDLKGKYSIPSLTAYLENPLTVRPSGRMPRPHLVNGLKDARDLANYLLQGGKTALPTGLGSSRFSYYQGSWENLPDFKKIKPNDVGNGSAFDLSIAKDAQNYAVKFEAVLKIETEGEFRFSTTSDDGSRLLIDGNVVVNNDGIHPPETAEGKAKLSKGIHRVEVDFFQGGGGAELEVTIEGAGLARQNLANLVAATEAELEKKAAPVPPKTADDDSITIKPELVEKGKALFASVGCASCHTLTVDKKPIVSMVKGQALEKLNPANGCMSEKIAKGLPAYFLNKPQQAALTGALKSPVAAETTPTETIARTMLTFNCYACHSRDKQGGPTEETNKSFLTLQPEMGDEGRVPPPLDLVGGKLNPDYFKQILDKGAHDRPYMLTHMPGFGLANVGTLVETYAVADKGKVPAAGAVEFSVPDTKVKATGRHLVSGAAFACIKCHTFSGVKAEGVQGIDMSIMTQRVQRDWFHAYLVDPQKIRPGTRMPTAWPEGKSVLPAVLDGKAATQIESIWVYLKQGRAAQIPAGLGPKSIPLMPIGEAIIYRNFIQGAGARAIGVGYPEKLSIAFDANEVRLAMLWQGYFIDAAKHWTDRGVGFEQPLGDNILHLHPGVPFAVLEKPDTAWPTGSAKDLGYKFGGYRVTTDERPTFLYGFGDIKVEDFPNAVGAKDPTLKRTLSFTAAKAPENLYFRAAVATKIEAVADGWFKVDGWKMKIEGSEKPTIRKVGNKLELLVPVQFKDGKAKITQEFAW